MALAYYDNDQNSGTGGIEILTGGISKVLGICFAIVAFALTLMFLTYSINDPSPLNSNDNVPQNALGAIGAWFADPMLMGLGRGVWILPLCLFAWAFRAIFSLGTKHIVSRIVFLPFVLLIWACFAATHSLSDSWPFVGQFGMGGDIGDKLLSILIAISPFGLGFSLFLWSILLGVVALASGAFVSGFRLAEVMGIAEKIISDTRNVIFHILGFLQNLRNTRSNKSMRPASSLTNAPLKSNLAKDPNAFSFARMFGTKTTKPKYAAHGDRSFMAAPAQMDAIREPVDLSERIRNIASRNSEQHHSLLKRSICKTEPTAPDFNPGAFLNRTDFDDGYSDLIEDENFDSYGHEIEPAAFIPTFSAREPIVQAPHIAPKLSDRAKVDAQPKFAFDNSQSSKFQLPSLSLLQSPDTITPIIPPREALEASARQLEAVLEDYGVKGEVVAVRPGPVVTMYELEPAAGLKASRIIGLADDIARSMSALTARVATIPGRSVIGIELPNEIREMVLLREIFAARSYGDSKLPLPLALGKDISGEPVVVNLAKMPHLLIAGTTGSGKSVAINTMILSLLYHATPEDVRMIMIDPKMLELSVYDDIPHLLSPVVTDPKKAVVALKWAVSEMEERYRKMSKMGVRNIDGYNARVKEALDNGAGFMRTVQTGFDDLTGEPSFETEEYAPEKMPYIVVIVDEMADLMMVAGKEIEACIQRLAQMARASGIHLIMATQRPSVDVITGTIKANFPTRISFQVTSKIDSRTILGEMGAEQLLGMGDMLYMSGGGRVTRVHGPFVSDQEVEEVVRHLKAQGEPTYHSGVLEGPEEDKAASIDMMLGLGNGDSDDVLYDQAVMIVARDRKCSTSYIQRKLSIGYNKAAKLVERMEDENVVSRANHVGKREILVPEIH